MKGGKRTAASPGGKPVGTLKTGIAGNKGPKGMVK